MSTPANGSIPGPDEIGGIERQIEVLKQQLSEARRLAKPEPVGEYTLRDADGQAVTLSSLFGDRRDLIVVHNMGAKCVYCTLWADGFNGLRKPLEDRAAFVLASPDEPAAMRAFAAGRGWAMRMVSFAGTSFAKDMGYEPEPGRYWPGVSGFHKLADGTIVRTGRATFGPGDDFCAVWPMFDLLAGGVGTWAPKYAYDGA